MEHSTTDTGGAAGSASTRPYLIRALHEWCTDNGFTPYIAVHVDRFVQVPMEYVSNNEIVLNVGFDATSSLELGNEFVQFKARFGGVAREIIVPMDHVVAIYARENGQGMAFPAPDAQPTGAPVTVAAVPAAASTSVETPRPPTPLHGLRLASVPDAAETAKIQTPTQPPTQSPTDGNEPDGPPGNGRPGLRRVK